MALLETSQKLKEIISEFKTATFLGELSTRLKYYERSVEKKDLSSPLMQIAYLAGLLVTSSLKGEGKIQCTDDDWSVIAELLKEIEKEYEALYYPENENDVTDDWVRSRSVVMPSFIGYFFQGPLNYEEQTLNWIYDLFSPLDDILIGKTGASTQDFINFYNTIDNHVQNNFQSLSSGKGLKSDWEDYAEIKLSPAPNMPFEMIGMFNERKSMNTMVADGGIIKRFRSSDLVTDSLSIEKINNILACFVWSRKEYDFLYFSQTSPANPISECPIIDLENGMYQIFDVKWFLHVLVAFLERNCTLDQKSIDRVVSRKGKLLEDNIVGLFDRLLGKGYQLFKSYYVDGNEQDILILWKNYAIIIEAKGYNIREPLRDPDKAFLRIKNDFKDSIGYGYQQARRIEKKIQEEDVLKIEDNQNKLIAEIDTRKYRDNELVVIVNLNSFGQIQNDLTLLLEIDEGSNYPWVVTLDDLETIILTILASGRTPQTLINYILLREDLHGRLVCMDELELCGAYLSRVLTKEKIGSGDLIVTNPEMCEIFENQYLKGMGFKNEKHLKEKKGGRHIFY